MEEDIKMIEDVLKDKDTKFWIGTQGIQAIENLIARYKELEEENRKLTARKYMLNAETGELKEIPIDNKTLPRGYNIRYINMTEEEKKAIEYIKSELQDEKETRNDYQSLTGLYGNLEIEIILNLIQKQDTEINKLKKEKEYYKKLYSKSYNFLDLKYTGDHIPRID